MSINYSSKTNERLIGFSISNESHVVGITGVAVVTPGLIRLVEVPQAPAPLSSVSVTGSGGPYNEITVGTPTGGQFLVDYTTGVIQFDVAQDGNTVLVSYIGLGSEIAAEDINELQGPVGIALNINGSLSNNIVKPVSISNTGTDDFTFPRDVVITREAKAVDFITASASPASTGVVRLAHSEAVVWRDNAGTGDSALATDASDNLTWKGSVIASPLGAVTSAQGTANEVLVNGTSGSAQVGALTLTTPQAIGTASTPTFASETLAATTNQLVLGVTNTTTITSLAPSASRIVTLPDAGTNSSFVLTESIQTINGALTLTSPLTSTASSGNTLIIDTNTLIVDATNHQVGIGTASPIINSILDLTSTTKGFLETRMSTVQRDAIGIPAFGTTTVVDYTMLSLATLTVAGHVLTEGTDWFAATSNQATADSLVTAINTLTEVIADDAVGTSTTITITAKVVVGSNLISLSTSDGTNLPVSGAFLTGEIDPPEGLQVYNLTTHQFEGFNNTSWVVLG